MITHSVFRNWEWLFLSLALLLLLLRAVIFVAHPAKFFQRFFQEKSNLQGYTEIGIKKCKPRKCN